MLIVEGADMLGKTTFAKRIAETMTALHPDWPIHYSHATKQADAFGFHDYAAQVNPFRVQDRFHMSRHVYEAVMTGALLLPPLDCQFIDAKLILAGSVTVVVTANAAFIRNSFQQARGHDNMRVETVIEANAGYMEIAAGNTFFTKPLFHYHHPVDGTPNRQYPAEHDGFVNAVCDAWEERLSRLADLNIIAANRLKSL